MKPLEADPPFSSEDLAQAWQHVIAGRGDRAHGEKILAHIAWLTGYYRVTSLSDYRAIYKTTEGYAEHVACLEAKREVYMAISNHLDLNVDAQRRIRAVERTIGSVRAL